MTTVTYEQMIMAALRDLMYLVKDEASGFTGIHVEANRVVLTTTGGGQYAVTVERLPTG